MMDGIMPVLGTRQQNEVLVDHAKLLICKDFRFLAVSTLSPLFSLFLFSLVQKWRMYWRK